MAPLLWTPSRTQIDSARTGPTSSSRRPKTMVHRRFIARTPRRFPSRTEGATLPYTCHIAALKTAVCGASGSAIRRPGGGVPAGSQEMLPQVCQGGYKALPRKGGSPFMPIPALLPVIAALLIQQAATPSPALDFEFFKARVQPIFLAKRPGHARCISCHGSGTPLRLQPLAPGATTWTEEESRKNFEAFKRVVVPGNPLGSRLLTHPLAQEAGGDLF